jgi:hypothetical protein
MTIEELKTATEKYRSDLVKKSGSGVLFSETGPANMGLIDAIIKTIEAQEQRIKVLEAFASKK